MDDFVGVAAALAAHTAQDGYDESGKTVFRSGAAVRFFLERGYVEDHKGAVILGKLLVSSGLIQRESGDPSEDFDDKHDSTFSVVARVNQSPVKPSRPDRTGRDAEDAQAQPNGSGSFSGAALPPALRKYHTLDVYRSSLKFYLIATNRRGDECKMLIIDRLTTDLSIREDPMFYTPQEVKEMMMMVKAGNQSSGGLVHVARAYGLIGFVRFLYGHYMILITARKRVGSFGPHVIYSVHDTAMVPITNPCVYEKAPSFVNNKNTCSIEARYKRLFQTIQLKQDFYFSYTFDISRTLQYNMLNADKPPGPPLPDGEHDSKRRCPKSSYIWNTFLLEPLRVADTAWKLYVTHGYFEQTQCVAFGRRIVLTLIARRSRLFAGTRYLKRGISNRGNVANDVEVEQVLTGFDKNTGLPDAGCYASYVQNRASIPLFWTQEGRKMVAKPDIILQKLDPLGLTTGRHFMNLFRRYGSPVLAVNLVRQKEKRAREGIIGSRFGKAVELLNQFLPDKHKIDYIAWDFKNTSTSKETNVMDELAVIADWALQRNGFFCSHPAPDAVERRPADTVGVKLGKATGRFSLDFPRPERFFTLSNRTTKLYPTDSGLGLRKKRRGMNTRRGSMLSLSRDTAPPTPRLRPTVSTSSAGITPTGDPEGADDEKASPRSPGQGSLGMATPRSLHASPLGSPRVDVDAPDRARTNWDVKPSARRPSLGQTDDISVSGALSQQRMKGLLHWIGSRKDNAASRKQAEKLSSDVNKGTVGGGEDAKGGFTGEDLPDALVPGLLRNPTDFCNLWSFDGMRTGSKRDKSSPKAKGAMGTAQKPSMGSSSRDDGDIGLGGGWVDITSAPDSILGGSKTAAKAVELRETADKRPVFHANVGVKQRGVMRVNCIDSLDRTNVAQFCVGRCALGYQLHALGMSMDHRIERDAPIVPILLDMYERMGDRLAIQYGGSEMHRQMANDKTASATMASQMYQKRSRPKTREMMISVMRHYQNSFQDNVKQNALNLLLGLYKPIPLEFNPQLNPEPSATPEKPKMRVKRAESGVTGTPKLEPKSRPPPPPLSTRARGESAGTSELLGLPPTGRGGNVKPSNLKPSSPASDSAESRRTTIQKSRNRFIQSTTRAFDASKKLGMECETREVKAATASGIPAVTTCVVSKVTKGGQAEKFGVELGWQVESIDRVPISTAAALRMRMGALSEQSEKKKIVIRFCRDGSTKPTQHLSKPAIARRSSTIAGAVIYEESPAGTRSKPKANGAAVGARNVIGSTPTPTPESGFRRLKGWLFGKGAKKKAPAPMVETREMKRERAHWQREHAKMERAVQLWEIKSDYYFHNDAPGTYEMIGKRSFLESKWWEAPIEAYESEIASPRQRGSTATTDDAENGRTRTRSTRLLSTTSEQKYTEERQQELLTDPLAAAESAGALEQSVDMFDAVYNVQRLSSFDSMLRGTHKAQPTTVYAPDHEEKARQLRALHQRRAGILVGSGPVGGGVGRAGDATSVRSRSKSPRAGRRGGEKPRRAGATVRGSPGGGRRNRSTRTRRREAKKKPVSAGRLVMRGAGIPVVPALPAHYSLALPSRRVFDVNEGARGTFEAYESWRHDLFKLNSHLVVAPDIDKTVDVGMPLPGAAPPPGTAGDSPDEESKADALDRLVPTEDETTFRYWPYRHDVSNGADGKGGEETKQKIQTEMMSGDDLASIRAKHRDSIAGAGPIRDTFYTIMGSGKTYLWYTGLKYTLETSLKKTYEKAQKAHAPAQEDEDTAMGDAPMFTYTNGLDDPATFGLVDNSRFYHQYLASTVIARSGARM